MSERPYISTLDKTHKKMRNKAEKKNNGEEERRRENIVPALNGLV